MALNTRTTLCNRHHYLQTITLPMKSNSCFSLPPKHLVILFNSSKNSYFMQAFCLRRLFLSRSIATCIAFSWCQPSAESHLIVAWNSLCSVLSNCFFMPLFNMFFSVFLVNWKLDRSKDLVWIRHSIYLGKVLMDKSVCFLLHHFSSDIISGCPTIDEANMESGWGDSLLLNKFWKMRIDYWTFRKKITPVLNTHVMLPGT